ncbi:helix-turn-helix domain-containing protein [Salipiger bermudensis]|uniref:HTH cro/C1-type domain-containing protein n=1 Tax=Salipiger bermudensis (strain DSM 26914 / JCM 13377 / KCTC 12554 / HTCC2601) TaxID=314265 RepID=Q0FLJ6_SALBH|nr:helix-turn-helix domain-containing protein [Salipiger bermudensis]EAU45102.1 hypothetical protein R2601_22986 [Salipiger bermudensis HTCC2601]
MSKTMTPAEIREARELLGLTQAELGRLLETDGQTVRRMEMDPGASTFRKPAPRMVRLIEAYLQGYHPADWPGDPEDPLDVIERNFTQEAGTLPGYVETSERALPSVWQDFEDLSNGPTREIHTIGRHPVTGAPVAERIIYHVK